MKKRLYMLPLALLLILCLAGCSKDSQKTVSYDVKSEKLQESELPAELPTEVSDWLSWDRESQWVKIGEATGGAAQLFANNREENKLYLLYKDKFCTLNWADVRKNEEDVRLFEYDIDGDENGELIALSSVSGGTNWHRERLYIIKSDGQAVTSTEFPISKFESWIKDNLSLNSSELSFFDLKLDISEKIGDGVKELADEISSISFSFENAFTMNIEISGKADSLISIAEITCELKYDNGNFSVENVSMKSPD